MNNEEARNIRPPIWLIILIVLFAAGVVWFLTAGLVVAPGADNGAGQADTAEIDDPRDGDSYIGMEESRALEVAAEHNVSARVVHRDGEDMAVTMDFVPGRLNFWIENGEVVSAVTDDEMSGDTD